MSDNTKIEWTDATWNPITGCSVVSAGCKNCYAMKLAGTRLQHHPSRAGLTIDTSNGPVWNGEVSFNEEWLDQPLKWKRPRMIFVCAHGDLFHESVPDAWIDRVFAVMAQAPKHTFQVLTKRVKRMKEYLSDTHRLEKWADADIPLNVSEWGDYPLPNVWLGVSVENQEVADARIPLLLQTPAAVRWISAEPLLGPVDLRRIFDPTGYACCGGDESCYGNGRCPVTNWPRNDGGEFASIDWVVVGGESGQNARPMHPDWARSLRDQCNAAGVALLFKQWGEWVPSGRTRELDARITMPGQNRNVWAWTNGTQDGWKNSREISVRMGRKAAGRMLDGRTWDEYPKVTS